MRQLSILKQGAQGGCEKAVHYFSTTRCKQIIYLLTFSLSRLLFYLFIWGVRVLTHVHIMKDTHPKHNQNPQSRLRVDES